MKTTQEINFFAPLPSRDLSCIHEFAPITLSPSPASQPALIDQAFQLDPADRFTYIIMGLAVVISILIPLLNWN